MEFKVAEETLLASGVNPLGISTTGLESPSDIKSSSALPADFDFKKVIASSLLKVK